MKKGPSMVSTLICLCGIVIMFSGCAALKDSVKGFLGVSTRALEEARKDAISKTFNYDYFTCYTQTIDALKRMKAYVYQEDIKKRFIAIYVTSEDTTAVGIFFTEVDANNTKIEVSSLSTYAKEFISNKLFLDLMKLNQPDEEEGKTDAKEEVPDKQLD
ncbi:MAG: DUF3568 family protein [Candidatus Omnitrophota bacterium]